jgi:hypothetical protein
MASKYARVTRDPTKTKWQFQLTNSGSYSIAGMGRTLHGPWRTTELEAAQDAAR